MAEELPGRVDVLCNACSFKAMQDGESFTLDYAWNPSRRPGEGDRTLLMAPSLLDVNPFKMMKARRMKCEGCGVTIYVAPSSQWLLDLKARIESSPPR